MLVINYLLSHSYLVRPSCVMGKKTASQKWPREILRVFFLSVFFRVTRDGLSERGTTRSVGWSEL